ncbi:MAG: LPS assembly lipoprotein LptE [Candidatus Protistobacter heckmanni]|nr:LPS assembly lipoprotein LptE [Candidatus Protistobacter heckmanni]
MRRRNLLILLPTLPLAASLTACGFHLRGARNLAFKSLFITGKTGSVAAEVHRNVRLGTDTKIVDNPKDAEAVLYIDNDARGRQILSLNSQGQACELRLSLSVAYHLTDGQGRELIPPSDLTFTRDLTFSESAVLGKQDEEAALYRNMEEDVAKQLLRHLSVVKPRGGSAKPPEALKPESGTAASAAGALAAPAADPNKR